MTVLFRDFSGPSLCSRGSVVCIGAFDGLHIGHQYLLGQAKLRAELAGLELCVLSFEPLPREYFAKNNPEHAIADNRSTRPFHNLHNEH